MRFVVGLVLWSGIGFAQGPEVDLQAPAPLPIDHFQTEKAAKKELPPFPETPPKAPRAPQIGLPMKDGAATTEYLSKSLVPDRTTRAGLVLSVVEPPLAKASLSDLKLKVLWEAAKQYRDAVEKGDREEIAKAGKVLDDALKATGEPAKSR